MPDERTVLMGDDATNGGLFMFVADKAADLSAGTLYVGKWTQTSANGGAATLSWIKLGTATSAEIKALVADGLKAADIVDAKTADPRTPATRRFRSTASQLGQGHAGHGKSRGVPGNASLCGGEGRQHGLYEVGRHHRQCRGQGRVRRYVRIESVMPDGSGGV